MSSGGGKTVRLHAFCSGRVQGVFFRKYTEAHVRTLAGPVTGFVRNLRDRRVEVVAEGPETSLQDLHAWLHKGSPGATVERVVANWSEPVTGNLSTFHIAADGDVGEEL